MWLPHPTVAAEVSGLSEDWTGGKCCAPFPDPSNGAQLWCCYAWPLEIPLTGTRAFFINQEGNLLQCMNHGSTPYTGAIKTPNFGEVYQVWTDMASDLRIGQAGGSDNTIWSEVWY